MSSHEQPALVPLQPMPSDSDGKPVSLAHGRCWPWRDYLKTIAIAIAGIVLVGWNMMTTWPLFTERAIALLEDTLPGGVRTPAVGLNAGYVDLVREYAPDAKNGFFWTIRSHRDSLGMRCRIERLNHDFHPMQIHFLKDADMDTSDFVMTDRTFQRMLMYELGGREILEQFPYLRRNEDACIFLRRLPE